MISKSGRLLLHTVYVDVVSQRVSNPCVTVTQPTVTRKILLNKSASLNTSPISQILTSHIELKTRNGANSGIGSGQLGSGVSVTSTQIISDVVSKSVLLTSSVNTSTPIKIAINGVGVSGGNRSSRVSAVQQFLPDCGPSLNENNTESIVVVCIHVCSTSLNA